MAFSTKTLLASSEQPINQLHRIPGNPDYLLSVSKRCLFLWNLQTQSCIGEIEGEISSLSIFDDRIAVWSGQAVRQYDMQTLKRTRTSKKSAKNRLLMSSLLLDLKESQIFVYSLKSRQTLSPMSIYCTKYLKISERFLIVSSTQFLNILDVGTRSKKPFGSVAIFPTCGAVMSGNRLAFNSGNTLHIYDIKEGEQLTINFTDTIVALAGQSDQTSLFVGFAHEIHYWSALPARNFIKISTGQNRSITSLVSLAEQRVMIGFDDGSISSCFPNEGSTSENESN